MNKNDLRKIFLAKRKSLTEIELAQINKAIYERFFIEFSFSEIRVIHCFLPIRRQNEVDTWPIIHHIHQTYPHIALLIPKTKPETLEMESYVWTPDLVLEENRWGIPEPISQQLIVNSGKVQENDFPNTQIDVVLVPLLAFDDRGYRVGYGKGFYDRFLQTCRPDVLKVGLSFFEPIEKIDDTDEHDIRLDFCITSEKIYIFN